MSVPEIEYQMGIRAYLTKTAGIGGGIRQNVENFVVEEILVDNSAATISDNRKTPLNASKERQQFLLSILVKRRWDTFIALKKLAFVLGISQERIQIAGIKDAKAVTSQFISVDGISAEEIAAVNLKDISVFPIGYIRNPLSSFYLMGNNFKIDIGGITHSRASVDERIAETTSQIISSGGIPNFYGHQRFGTIRAITHLVGKALAKGDLEEAAMIFLAKSSPFEHPESAKVREELWITKNFNDALKGYPVQLRFERLMLAHLVKNCTDFSGAFRKLPLKLRMLFVQAWQSYLYNLILSSRMSEGLSLSKAEVGDYVVHIDRSGIPMINTGRTVEEGEVRKVNDLIRNGKLRLALPIFGSKLRLSGGKMGELERQIMETENLNLHDFAVPSMPELGAKGELRAIVCPISNFSRRVECPDSNKKLKAHLEFMLLRGAYATVFLREIIKPQDLISAGF